MSDDFQVCIWADGTWCYEEDLYDMLHMMSDDYEVRSLEDLIQYYIGHQVSRND